jgi:hypothetical protein
MANIDLKNLKRDFLWCGLGDEFKSFSDVVNNLYFDKIRRIGGKKSDLV